MRSGVDPRVIDTMSLYEIISMNAELGNLDGAQAEKPMTQDRMNELKAKWESLSLPDVVLH